MTERSSVVIGAAAACGSALIAAAWLVATRAGVTTSLKPLDLALFRFGIPALMLLPLVLKNGFWPSPKSKWLFWPLFFGAGLSFSLTAMFGAKWAPAAHMGALLPGTIPLFTALLALLLFGDLITRGRWFGFALIITGVLLVGSHSFNAFGEATLWGDFFFLMAAFRWAVYTVTFHVAGLTPWHATAILAQVSTLIMIPIWIYVGGPARMMAAPFSELVVQAVAQGFMAGLLGLWTYSLAIRHLGPQRAALSSATVPALAMLGGFLVLGERPGMTVIAGVLLTVAGVAIAALAAAKRQS